MFLAVIVCTSATETGKAIVETLDDLHLARDHNSLTIFVDVSSLPSWLLTFSTDNNNNNNSFYSNVYINYNHLINKISFVTKKYLLIFSENFYSDSNLNLTFTPSVENFLLSRINYAALSLSEEINRETNFVLLDLNEEGNWRPLLTIKRTNLSDFLVTKIMDNLDEWTLKHKHNDECEGCENEFNKLVSVLLILGCSFISVSFLLGTVILVRNQFLKKNLSKGPYKVILTATDFVFPQIPDSRRVSKCNFSRRL